MIRAAGARLLYLPPNSPDLDPIEKACARIKAAICKAAHCTIDKLWDTIGGHIDAFTPKECDNYFTPVARIGTDRILLWRRSLSFYSARRFDFRLCAFQSC
jgi:transposase